MAEIESWQRQNMKKSGAAPAPHQMHEKLSGGMAGLHSKIAKPTVPCGGQVMGAKQVKGYADGGEVEADAADKAAGLAASNEDMAGKSKWEQAKESFGRLFKGNIDDPNSQAYKEYGAGRARANDGSYDRLEAKRFEQANAGAGSENSAGEYMEAPKEAPSARMSADDFRASEKDRTPVAAPKKTSFKEAFAAAKDGSTFEWNGKSYKKEFAQPKKAATPKAAAPAAEEPMSDSQRAGSDFVALQRAYDTMPAETSTAARQALAAQLAKAKQKYEDSARK